MAPLIFLKGDKNASDGEIREWFKKKQDSLVIAAWKLDDLKKTLISTTIIVSDRLCGLCSSAAYQNQGNQHVSQHGDNGYKRLVQIVTQMWLPFHYWDLVGGGVWVQILVASLFVYY